MVYLDLEPLFLQNSQRPQLKELKHFLKQDICFLFHIFPKFIAIGLFDSMLLLGLVPNRCQTIT